MNKCVCVCVCGVCVCVCVCVFACMICKDEVNIDQSSPAPHEHSLLADL